MALKIVKPKTEPQKATQTTMDTIAITRKQLADGLWRDPPFQRPLRINAKLKAIAEDIVRSEVIPGIITLGVYGGETYLLDGQHRKEAFLISNVNTGYCDVRIHHFETMADMGREFVALNSRISTLRPDDILRGLESSNEALSLVRRRCPFVGYDMIRRGPNSPLLSMSLALRSWARSRHEVPTASSDSAIVLAETFTVEAASELVVFLGLAEKAWGRDHEYARLWSGLNLTVTMWLYRRIVLGDDKRYAVVTKDVFCKAMMSLSADEGHLSWLLGRIMSERDRSPAYSRIKSIVGRRIEQETGKKLKLPQPAWAKS
jgi:hypothetical protein